MRTKTAVLIKEQRADHYGLVRTRRASLSAEERVSRNQSSLIRAGTSVGIHPESTPYTTTQRFPHGNTDENEALSLPQRMTSSARRYAQPQQQHTRAPISRIEEESHRQSFSLQRFLVQCAVVMALATALAVVWFSLIMPAFQSWHDDIVYGTPRTYQVDAPHLGHFSGHFIAVNNHGTIELVHVPDHPDKEALHLYILARFTGDTASTLPITSITFHDINGDGYPDIEVVVDGTEYILFDDGKGILCLTPPQKG